MMKSSQTIGRWLHSAPKPDDRIRLFCLPYAGGSASVFREWQQELPVGTGVYAIQLPGRENRIAETPIRDMTTIVEAMANAIIPHLQLPFMLFGHSLGARIAFELVRHLRRNWGIRPARLIVAGSRAPQMPEPRPLHHLPEVEFLKELRRFSGTPEAIFQSKELMALLLPMLRADFAVDETYIYREEAPLDCPISAFCGTRDEEAKREDMQAWADYTRSEFTLEMIEGEHFFLKTQRAMLLQAVSRLMLQHMESR
jgi:surfactin synthase thioesterase subunit